MQIKTVLPALCVLLVALAVRAPLIGADSPYFYHEDDAHHFNRTVRMYQTKDLNPHYFNKPSLHFYIRIPVVAASVEWLKSRGELNSSRDIRTRDPYGLAGYAFTVSHEAVLEWNRALSVLMSVVTVLLTFLIATKLGLGAIAASLAALVPALSLEVVRNSHLIAVDVPMALLCVATTLACVLAYNRYSIGKLALCGILAGLACSTKYNAAPICLAPLALCLSRSPSLNTLFVCFISPIVGFVLGSPFVIWEPFDFVKGVSYEIWHYGVAGHDQHSAKPGLEQMIFYLKWAASEGAGLLLTIAALVGLFFATKVRTAKIAIVFVFPLAYAGMMVLQKANFTRNMVCIVPYIGLAAALVVDKLSTRSVGGQKAALLVVLLLVVEPIVRTTIYVQEKVSLIDSRDRFAMWLETERASSDNIAVAGPLQIPISLFYLPGVDSFNPTKTTPSDLYQSGYDLLVIPKVLDTARSTMSLPLVADIAGTMDSLRVPIDPALVIRRLTRELLPTDVATLPKLKLDLTAPQPVASCGGTIEGHCWFQSRRSLLELQGNTGQQLELTSPWAPQSVTFSSTTGEVLRVENFEEVGQLRTFTLPSGDGRTHFIVDISTIRSPSAWQTSSDNRTLGVSIRPR